LNYFGSYRIFKNKTKSGYKVLEYLNNPWAYERGIKPYWSFTNNRMAVEFDFPSSLFNQYSKEESTAYLEKLDSNVLFGGGSRVLFSFKDV
jgi:nuclear transport factor 2 (NTF2) superfamily protein